MAQSLSEDTIRSMAGRWMAGRDAGEPLVVHTDTTDFFSVQYNDVLLIDGRPFLIRHNAREGRFGLDDEVKHWVKRAIDLQTGDYKFVKLVFYEKFVATVGTISYECFRSPRKEARILRLVEGHPNFMQGYSVEDDHGNLVRIVDHIFGPTLPSMVENLDVDHRTYFLDHFPGLLERYIECVRAIGFLHANGEKHGDIRRDHILVDRETGRFRWIDFDFNYRHNENIYGYDLFGLGNILMFLVGKGDVSIHDLKQRGDEALGSITADDVNIVFHNRVANLGKIYPYIPESLNRVLMHFSQGSHWFYEHTDQLLEDLETFRRSG